MRILLLAASLWICDIAKSATYYVSPTGNDNNPGTITQPFKNWDKLSSVMVAGDIAYIRGGTYTSPHANSFPAHCYFNSLVGTSSNPINIFAYPGEVPVLNLGNITPTYSDAIGIYLKDCQYLHIKGLTVTFLKQIADGSGISRGLNLWNSQHCIVEQCEVYNIGGTGVKIEGGSSDNLLLNCDSHHNGDGVTDNGADAWDNADGFSVSTADNLSQRNVLEGCRMWLNSDDGYDNFGSNSTITLKNCWSFWNGVKPWGISLTQPDGVTMTANNYATWHSNSEYWASSGEGFKMGPANSQDFNLLTKFIINCVSFENRGTGYASNSLNSLTTKHQFYNNIAFKNDNDGFSYGAGWSVGASQIFKNNWAWGNNILIPGANFVYDGIYTSAISNNSWDSQVSISNADFLSVSSVGMDGPRQADGSLPVTNFLKLAPSSDLINKGIDVGLPFNGSAPDLGAYEYGATINVAPVANAGADQSITLPVSVVTLSGTGTDTDGTITGYQWKKISGPVSVTIGSALLPTTTVSALLLAGVYQFELTVTDNSGATDADTMQVTVLPLLNQAPSANAGSDQSITLPVNSVSLNGNGTDPDGTISSYLWTKLSGPAAGNITNATVSATTVTGMAQGTYQFQLQVTDNSGAVAVDVMQVTVNAAPNQTPSANAGPDQAITLPVNLVSLSGTGTDADGTITAYRWKKVSGPASFSITSSTTASTTVTGLVQGIYNFEFKVTDNNGAAGFDTVQVIVNAAVNQGPTANAGSDQIVTLPASNITLSGSGTDPDGTITDYNWVQLSGPSSATITNNAIAITTATGLIEGIYQFQLQVLDNNGSSATDIVQVTVNPAANEAPTADAGPNQNITLPTSTTTLSGNGTDPDGTIVSYTWVQISGPASSSIANAAAATTDLSGLVQGVYQFQLQVTDNSGATGIDVVQVNVNAAPPPANQLPTADAGPDQDISLPTNSISLNGSGTDPDGTITAYFWRRISGPGGISIANNTAAVTNVNNLSQGSYRFELKVTDNSGATDRDTVLVTVSAAPNQAPIANAGVDKTITLPTNSTSLNGSGTDPDGIIFFYSWTKLSGPASGTLANSNNPTTLVSGLTQGIYTYQLKVTDNNGATDTDTVQVTVNPAPNQAPTANAGANQTITLPTNTITLSGSGSDADGNITNYLWVKVSGPTNGNITSASSATTTVTGLVQGVYQFQLQVTDNNGATDTDIMQVNVNAAPNQAPIANAGSDKTITLPLNNTSLNGSGTDPDGTITAYAWTKISGPASGSITNATAATASATGLVQGIYKFQLKVTDNSGASARDTMQITVNAAANQLPVADAGADQNITLPTNSTSLTGSGTDPDGTIANYLWTKISGPTAGTIANANAATTSVAGLTQGVYKFQLKVTDNSGATDTDTMQVTVNPAANQLPTANAGIDQVITLPVNSNSLTGSGTDPDGTITAYLWTKISGPSAGTITNPNSAATTVTGLIQGVYKFQLKVTDNSGATDVDTMQVVVHAANLAPSANAGLDQNITLPTNIVSLSGSGTDADGTITAYLWTKISGPTAGSITNGVAATTTVTGLAQGIYKFQLKVTDNSGATDVDTMQVTVNPAVNQLPTANAGVDKVITLPTNIVLLAGTGTDPDGTITAYLWTKISGPANGSVTNATLATATAAGLVQGIYKFQLKVTDNSGATDVDTMQVTVNPFVNQPPVANAGPDINITLPTNIASLNGSGTDPDGTITAYLWTKISGPTSGGSISIPTSATTSATALVQGVYKFQLKVTDNNGATDVDTIQVTVNPAANQPPTANAGNDKTITLPVTTATLDGSGTDPDGTITAYAWTKISGPANGTITNPAAAATSATGLSVGVYKFQLKVTDNSGATDTDTMQVTVNAIVNQLPTANAGADQNITLPVNQSSLNGSGTDPDGTITAYAWTKIAGPVSGMITNPSAAVTTVTGLTEGVYKFQLKVTDNSGATDTDTMQVTVNAALPVNEPPVANAGPDSTIQLPVNSISLSGTGTDADGAIVSYSWKVISGAAYLLMNADNAVSNLGDLQEGTYEAELTVTDNDGATAKDTVKITVTAAAARPVKNDVVLMNNPVTNNILTAAISSVSVNIPVKMRLVDARGVVLEEREVRLNQNSLLEQINMEKYSKGTYILQVYFNNKMPVAKKAIKL
jgi:hypothetical protein